MPRFEGRLEESVPLMYGRRDLSKYPLFQGGFINFGYWERIPKKIKKLDRARASRKLYEKILDRLEITDEDTVLEVGCGRGLGCVMALDSFHANQAWGLDAAPEQIARCQKAHQKRIKKRDLHFIKGLASSIPFSNEKFHKIFSVEAAQHFPSLPPFFHEVWRVLKPGGKFVMTTFFKEEGATLKNIGQWIQTVEKKIDFFHPIQKTLRQLKKAGFANITHKSIGKNVWRGMDRWNSIVLPNDWGKNWWIVYEKGLVDYYIIEASKS